MIALIKLTNGTEIIGDVIKQDSEFITVKDPLQINYRQRLDMAPPTVSLHRFNPFASNTEHMFRDEHILNYSVPLPGLVKYYTATLGTIKDNVDSHVNNELVEAANSYLMEDSEEDEVKKAMYEMAQLKPLLN